MLFCFEVFFQSNQSVPPAVIAFCFEVCCSNVDFSPFTSLLYILFTFVSYWVLQKDEFPNHICLVVSFILSHGPSSVFNVNISLFTFLGSPFSMRY